MGRKTITIPLKEKSEGSSKFNISAPARNLTKDELGAIIFGCKHNTIKECLDREIFGLPAAHYSYVRKATPGLPLFLFNYSDRKLHGVFEAVSSGQMNIYPDAWVTAGMGSETTPYPAQVRIRARNKCRPLLEEEIKSIIAKNYYTDKLLWFELDKEQTKRLMRLFLASPLPENMPRPSNIAWKRNSFNLPPNSNIKKTADEEFKNVDWAAYSGMAEARLKDEHSNASASNRDAFAPSKKWSELFKPSQSSSAVNNGEVLEPQKVLSPSKLYSNAWSELPPEACYGAANAECDSYVPESWEDIAFVDNDVKEIRENCEEHHDGDRGKPNLSDKPTFLDGWGELRPSEFDNVRAEEPGEFFIGSKASNRSGIALTPVEDCERDRDQLNETDRVFQDNNYVLSEGVLTDAQSSYFQQMITKVMKDIEELKVSQLSQSRKIEILQQELVHSKQETNELKKMLGIDRLCRP
ncbi:hypothetical protein C2S51_033699 [Perilla frutescens var. frutescens]|nr:hypothetical protein C2S51_033699 [Perilla frutescens var. frutescens]